MALIVQKYGGSSVGTLDRLQQVSKKIIAAKQQRHDVVVVVSAMYGETDRLIQLAYTLTPTPHPRDYDMLISVGEQVAMALLSMTLNAQGYAACCFTGAQIGLYTDNAHMHARIMRVETAVIRRALDAGHIIVVAGFQGVTETGDITTLGRGGSDATAVALAVALGAEECQIYTDVKGVYTTDPHVLPEARLLPQISFAEMLEMSGAGSKVLQQYAVALASRHAMPIRVLSTFVEEQGTMVLAEEHIMQTHLVSGIAFSKEEAVITLADMPGQLALEVALTQAICQANIQLDMLTKQVNTNLDKASYSFSLPRKDGQQACEIVRRIMQQWSTSAAQYTMQYHSRVAKLSVIGIGMRSNMAITHTLLATLQAAAIAVYLLTTSEIKISAIIDETHLEKGVRALHTAFNLHLPAVDTEQ